MPKRRIIQGTTNKDTTIITLPEKKQRPIPKGTVLPLMKKRDRPIPMYGTRYGLFLGWVPCADVDLPTVKDIPAEPEPEPVVE